MAVSRSRDAGKQVRASLPAPKKKDTTAVVSFFFGFREKLKCSAEVNSASAKIFAHGKNTCTAQERRRPVEPEW